MRLCRVSGTDPVTQEGLQHRAVARVTALPIRAFLHAGFLWDPVPSSRTVHGWDPARGREVTAHLEWDGMLRCRWEQRKGSLGITCEMEHSGAKPAWMETSPSPLQVTGDKM